MNRAERRAAERKAVKMARKAGFPIQAAVVCVPAEERNSLETETTNHTGQALAVGASFGLSESEAHADRPEPISDARLAANRANAQLSTGPVSPEGKTKSSLNAVKTGLTGRTVLLPADDAAIYQQHLDRYFAKHAPSTDEERSLTQSIADTEWRLLRIAPLEAGLYAVGRRKLADLFVDEQNPVNREALIHAEVFLTFRKDFSNLALQERRLFNQRNADVAQLEQLQKDRSDKYAADLKRATALYKSTQKLGLPFDPAYFGFVFSIEELEDHINREQATAFAQGQPSDFTKEQFEACVAKWKERKAA
jgi:hypothetical protein